MTLHCLFHADDFSLNESCSNGIIKAMSNGRLQATSIVAGGADQSNYDRLKSVDPLYVNVHLNLLEGRALHTGGNLVDIATSDGFFHLTLGQLLLKLANPLKRDLLRSWIFDEFCKQIDYVHAIFPEKQIRLDGHLHIHVLPALRPVIRALIEKYPIAYIRTPSEKYYRTNRNYFLKLKGNARRSLLSHWAKGMQQILRRYNVSTADYFLGSTSSCDLTLADIDNGLAKIKKLAGKKDVLVEVMTHPIVKSLDADRFYKDSRYISAHITDERCNELDALISEDLVDILLKNDAVFFTSDSRIMAIRD